MLYQFSGRNVWLADDGDVIADQINEDETPRSATVKALEAGGMTPEQIAAELADWVD